MKTIMIVDDEPDILEKVRSCLEYDEFDVVTVVDSRKALELLEGNKEESFGLILIDTPMPGTKKSALFSMKPGSKMDVKAGDVDDFLQKPFTDEQLLDFVKKRVGIL